MKGAKAPKKRIITSALQLFKSSVSSARLTFAMLKNLVTTFALVTQLHFPCVILFFVTHSMESNLEVKQKALSLAKLYSARTSLVNYNKNITWN